MIMDGYDVNDLEYEHYDSLSSTTSPASSSTSFSTSTSTTTTTASIKTSKATLSASTELCASFTANTTTSNRDYPTSGWSSRANSNTSTVGTPRFGSKGEEGFQSQTRLDQPAKQQQQPRQGPSFSSSSSSSSCPATRPSSLHPISSSYSATSSEIRTVNSITEEVQCPRETVLRLASCLQCTLLGLKCDRQLPSCTRCSRRQERLEHPPILPPSSSSGLGLGGGGGVGTDAGFLPAFTSVACEEQEKEILTRQKCIPLRVRERSVPLPVAASVVAANKIYGLSKCRDAKEKEAEVDEISRHCYVRNYVHGKIEMRNRRKWRWIERVAFLHCPAPSSSSSSSATMSSSRCPSSSTVSVAAAARSCAITLSAVPLSPHNLEKSRQSTIESSCTSKDNSENGMHNKGEVHEEVDQHVDQEDWVLNILAEMQKRKMDRENWILPRPSPSALLAQQRGGWSHG